MKEVNQIFLLAMNLTFIALICQLINSVKMLSAEQSYIIKPVCSQASPVTVVFIILQSFDYYKFLIVCPQMS